MGWDEWPFGRSHHTITGGFLILKLAPERRANSTVFLENPLDLSSGES
jgi:hypothetical protein